MLKTVSRGVLAPLMAIALACASDKTVSLPARDFTNVADSVVAVRSGALEPSEATQFTRIVRVVIGPDSNVFVLDADRQWVTVFAPNGATIRRIGNKGSGPGEFEGPIQRIGFSGDTLWVQDWVRNRTNWFGLDGKLLRQSSDTLRIDRDSFPGLQLPLAYLRSGVMLYESNEPALTLSATASGPIIAVREDGKRDTLAWRAAWRGLLPIPNAGTLRVASISNGATLAFDGFGNGVALVSQTVNEAHRGFAIVSIQKWNSRGVRIANQTLGVAATTPVPTAAHDSIYSAATASLARLLTQIPEVRKAVSDPAPFIANALHVPRFYPVVQDARALTDGELWLRLDDASDSQRWLVVDAAGRPYVLVKLPRSVRLEDVAHGKLWVSERDSLDAMTIAAYTLRKFER